MSSPTLGYCSSSGSAQFLSQAGLNGYVPRWLLDAAREGAPLQPRIAPMRAAVVFADISGFSRLTRLYQEKGEAGVEELSLIIGDYLGKIIERVFAWGGDVENIYGDALLAFWPETEAGFTTAMTHALGCAADIVGRHDLYEAPGGVVLRIRAAAVAGDLFFAQAGVSDEFVFMLTGACLLDIEAMLGCALPGQVAASPALRAAFTSVPEFSSAQLLTEQTGGARSALPFPDVREPDRDRMLHVFVPATVRRRNQLRPEWLAEFRRLAVLCVGIPDLLCRGSDDLAAIQDAVATIQTLVHRFEGGLIRMSMSDKGPMALIAFGLPDQAHDDDAIRAVRAAQEIVSALAGKNLPARGTVTFGLAYCGVIGNRDRHTYTAMGDTVNLAAKLLSRAELSSIICDEAIMLAAGHRVRLRTDPRRSAECDCALPPTRLSSVDPPRRNSFDRSDCGNRVAAAPFGPAWRCQPATGALYRRRTGHRQIDADRGTYRHGGGAMQCVPRRRRSACVHHLSIRCMGFVVYRCVRGGDRTRPRGVRSAPAGGPRTTGGAVRFRPACWGGAAVPAVADELIKFREPGFRVVSG